ncbi:MAG: tetraacyldisaccharide 4'-kinase [Gammaproteobacteria bacterium]|jgi:tetraacyldisaccharide 4'-kinase
MFNIYQRILSAWYQKPWLFFWLLPFSLIYQFIIFIRRFLYQHHFLKKYRAPCPVIVVGNFVVGGTGKTPMVIALAQLLMAKGYKPGIVTRGYGGSHIAENIRVNPNSDPKIVGDEPVLMAAETNCPIVKNKNRALAAKLLADECDIIISDDGLQHYALISDIKIAMQPNAQYLKNAFLLPAGPWREPKNALKNVDFVQTSTIAIDYIYALNNKDQRFTGKHAHALCAIAAPWRFFTLLNDFGIETINHAYPDHFQFSSQHLKFADDLPILITEKDAVKCKDFNIQNVWVVKIKTHLDPEFTKSLFNKINTLKVKS